MEPGQPFGSWDDAVRLSSAQPDVVDEAPTEQVREANHSGFGPLHAMLRGWVSAAEPPLRRRYCMHAPARARAHTHTPCPVHCPHVPAVLEGDTGVHC